MAFNKIGMIFKITDSKIVDLNGWQSFKKQASVVNDASAIKESDTEKQSDISKESDLEVVAAVNPEKFIYIHTTIMAGVKTESNEHWVTPETEKFINDNHDAWTCGDLLKDHKSFKRAITFVEHDQHLEKAKGKCIDVVARQMPDTILIDVLFSVDKKHADLVDNIKNGIINAVSMGCSTEKTKCTICGHEAKDSANYCQCIRNYKGQMVKCSDGKMRKAAELCLNNTFFDVSLVANPAFVGAVFRKILSKDEISAHVLSKILSNKIESSSEDGNLILKAASAELNIQSSGEFILKEGEKELIKEKLSEEELKNIKTLFSNKKHTKFLSKIVDLFFKKDSGYHPILNASPEKDFSISDEDHSEIPLPYPQTRFRNEAERQVELRLREPVEEGLLPRANRGDMFECYHCAYTDELWQVKASSIDNKAEGVLVCPECGFFTELATKPKLKVKLTTIDKMHLADLGYSNNDIASLNKNQIQKVIAGNLSKGELKKSSVDHSILKALLENGKKLDETLQMLNKGQVFVATADIPVDNDEGTLHFDETGSSVIMKNEKLTFLGTVENGEYGFFKTETGEEFFTPVATLKKKVINAGKDSEKVDWKKAEFGDSARVVKDNKMGLIVEKKDEFFKIKFMNGKTEWHEQQELEFWQ